MKEMISVLLLAAVSLAQAPVKAPEVNLPKLTPEQQLEISKMRGIDFEVAQKINEAQKNMATLSAQGRANFQKYQEYTKDICGKDGEVRFGHTDANGSFVPDPSIAADASCGPKPVAPKVEEKKPEAAKPVEKK